MKNKEIKRNENLKNLTYIIVLTIIFMFFLTGYSLGKNSVQLFLNGNTEIANPIIEVESNPKINITDENQQGIYKFLVRNYNNEGKITDVKMKYVINIEDTIDEKLKDTIKYELYKNGNKIVLNKNSTEKMEMPNNKQQEDIYELKIFYDKVASSFMKDIVEKIQIKIHSEQLK